MMNKSIALMSAPLPPSTQTRKNYVRRVVESVKRCSSVDVLIIGSLSSFINYNPSIRSKTRNVVIMGKPLSGDTTQRAGNYSFKCEYDMATWRPPLCIEAGTSGHGAAVDGADYWAIDCCFRAGGKSLMWDQMAALFLLYHEVFVKVGGAGSHYEPTVTPSSLRQMWTDASSKSGDYVGSPSFM